MKKISTILILTSILLSLACVLGAQTIKPPKVEQRIMFVPGNKDFTKTNLTLNLSDRVTITATGKVYFCAGAESSGVGPDGWPRATFENSWPDDVNECLDPLMDAGHAALIADGGGGEKFLVGAKKVFSGKAGLFYLGINDCSFTGNWYNTGQFSVIIKVERNAVPFKK